MKEKTLTYILKDLLGNNFTVDISNYAAIVGYNTI